MEEQVAQVRPSTHRLSAALRFLSASEWETTQLNPLHTQVRARREALEKLTSEAALQRVRDLATSAEYVRERHAEDQAAVMEAIERTAAAAEAALVQRVSEEQVEQLAKVEQLARQVLDGSASALGGLRPPPVADGEFRTDRDRREPESR